MKRLVFFGAGALCFASAALGVWDARRAASAMEPHETLDLAWARYPGHQVRSSSPELRLDGQERELAYFLSDDDPIAIAEHYAALWQTTGFHVDRRFSEGEEFVTATDTRERRSAVVTRRRGYAVVFVSRRWLDEKPYRPAAPLLDECEPLHHSSSRDGDALRELLTLRCEIEGDALIERYHEHFGSPTRSLSDGRRGFASFGTTTENADLSVVTTEVDGQPVTAATLRYEVRR
ncbi:MAG: hypothetical protein AAF658_07475 [Myxococcota bacterium]